MRLKSISYIQKYLFNSWLNRTCLKMQTLPGKYSLRKDELDMHRNVLEET